jgi:hypothetical protein
MGSLDGYVKGARENLPLIREELCDEELSSGEIAILREESTRLFSVQEEIAAILAIAASGADLFAFGGKSFLDL